MLDFKKMLGDKYREDLTADEVLALLTEYNLADLSSGEYVSKGKFDAKESEIAKLQGVINSYKEKETANLTDAEKRELEIKDMQNRINNLTKETEKYKLRESILKSGYTNEECDKIIEAQEKGENLAAVYSEIMKSKIEDAVKSAKTESISKGTPPPPQGGIDGDDGDDDEAVAFAKQVAKNNAVDTKSLESIKGAYSSLSDD